jgi:hypothetical protein
MLVILIIGIVVDSVSLARRALGAPSLGLAAEEARPASGNTMSTANTRTVSALARRSAADSHV